MRIALAFKAFFRVLFDSQVAESVRESLETSPELSSPPLESTASEDSPMRESAQVKPRRSDAVTLLATLQRDARFVDLLQESLDDYNDQQIGAAARDVLRDARKAIDRIFEIQPLTSLAEGETMQTESEVDAGQIRLVGNVEGDAPFEGAIAHHGWRASKCDIPTWNGTAESNLVIAPIELEVS